MNDEIRSTLKNALSNYRGDDFERAKMAFARFTPEQMEDEHGQSGQTRQQILDAYAAHAARVQAAVDWVDSQ